MVIEQQGKSDCEHQENHDHNSIDVVPNRDGNQISEDNHSLCRHYVCQDRTDKKSFLAIE